MSMCVLCTLCMRVLCTLCMCGHGVCLCYIAAWDVCTAWDCIYMCVGVCNGVIAVCIYVGGGGA